MDQAGSLIIVLLLMTFSAVVVFMVVNKRKAQKAKENHEHTSLAKPSERD